MEDNRDALDYGEMLLANAPRQQRSRALTLRILEASLRVLRRPDSNFTIRAVAQEAGASVGGICGRFVDREELLCAVHSHVVEKLENRVRKNLAEQGGSLRETLHGFINAVANTYREDGLAMAKVQAEPFADRFLARAAGGVAAMQALLGEAIGRHRDAIVRPDFAFAIHIVTQMVMGTMTREVTFQQRGNSERSWSKLCEELEVAANAYLTAEADALPALP